MLGIPDLKSDELPTIKEVYKLYNDDDLNNFASAATILLKEDDELSKYHAITLLLLLANVAGDHEETFTYYNIARDKLEEAKAKRYREMDDKELDDLEEKLQDIRELLEEQRGAPLGYYLLDEDDEEVEDEDDDDDGKEGKKDDDEEKVKSEKEEKNDGKEVEPTAGQARVPDFGLPLDGASDGKTAMTTDEMLNEYFFYSLA